jgi:FKBP-type peptidyl-prolyl cis-trans isomerase
MKKFSIVIAVVLVVAVVHYFTEERPLAPPSEGDLKRNPSTIAQPRAAPATPPPSHSEKEKELPGGLKYEDLDVGKGDEAKFGDKVSVHYTGWLVNNEKFDSSLDRGEPFEFTIGQGVIAGWSQGVPGMKAGGKRKLIIPPGLGYGAGGSGKIPGNATLIFLVELLQIQK